MPRPGVSSARSARAGLFAETDSYTTEVGSDPDLDARRDEACRARGPREPVSSQRQIPIPQKWDLTPTWTLTLPLTRRASVAPGTGLHAVACARGSDSSSSGSSASSSSSCSSAAHAGATRARGRGAGRRATGPAPAVKKGNHAWCSTPWCLPWWCSAWREAALQSSRTARPLNSRGRAASAISTVVPSLGPARLSPCAELVSRQSRGPELGARSAKGVTG